MCCHCSGPPDMTIAWLGCSRRTLLGAPAAEISFTYGYERMRIICIFVGQIVIALIAASWLHLWLVRLNCQRARAPSGGAHGLQSVQCVPACDVRRASGPRGP